MNRFSTFLFLTFPAPAMAANVLVDPTGGGDAISIGAAIGIAASGDTVRVSPGTYYETLDTGGKDLDFVTTDGAKSVTLDGNGAGVLLTVTGGETVSMEGFILRDAVQAVDVDGSALALRNVAISRLTGTAVVVGNGATMNGVGITVSLADAGGVNGGAFHVRHATLTLNTSEVSENNAAHGGGVYGYNADLIFTSVTMRGNGATSGGGGVYLANGSTLTADRVTLEDNKAPLGGGVFAEGGELEWLAGDILNNSATSQGGGLYMTDDAEAILDGDLTGNVAGGSGGGIFVDSGLLTVTSDLSANTADGLGGGGIWLTSGELTLTGSSVTGHSAADGGAVYIDNQASAAIQSCVFSDNVAALDGGAVHARGSLELRDNRFSNNIAGGRGGGVWGTKAISVVDGIFRGNIAASGGGIASADALTLDGTFFELNEAGDGAALFHEGAGTNLVIMDAAIERNLITEGAEETGGAISAIGSAAVRLTGVTLSDHDGAALSLTDTTLEAFDVLWQGNAAGVTGAGLTAGAIERSLFLAGDEGLSLTDSAGVTVTNSQFLGQSVAAVRAAGASELTLTNLEIIGNARGGDAVDGALISLVNVIAIHNAGGSIGADKLSTVAASYSDLWRNGDADPLLDQVGADGNISEDPGFFEYTNDGTYTNDVFYLTVDSLCRDAGDPTILDLDGSASDMGSYGGPGASDLDEDGDGYPVVKGDCDDSDPAVNPGQEEIWYDGVDGDCDGANDYDQDGDGYYDPSSGITDEDDLDCDDTEPTIHAGANDPDGDGIDQNCDGEDGLYVEGDDDRDGDGFNTTEDCNDDDPGVNPVVAEDCYDGRDNDCDGSIDSDDTDCVTDKSGCSAVGSTPGLPPAGAASLLLALGILVRRRR